MANNQSDEALNIFKSLKETGTQVLTLVNTLIDRVVNCELDVEHGISLLDVKNQLMIQYLLNLAQLIILKATGKSIEGNSTVDRLIEDRVILERCKPIEQKLKYQIEKYVRRAVIGSVDENDPSSYKANPKDLILKVSNYDEDTEDEVTDKGSEERRDKKKSDVYVPPKLTSVPYEEDEHVADKQKKLYERSRKHALRSSVIQELKEEYLDVPLEVRATNSVLQREDNYQKMKRDYEETYFTRLPVTKEERRKAKMKFSLNKLSEEVTHFEDTSILHDETGFINNKRKRIQKKGKAKLKKRRKIHKWQYTYANQRRVGCCVQGLCTIIYHCEILGC